MMVFFSPHRRYLNGLVYRLCFWLFVIVAVVQKSLAFTPSTTTHVEWLISSVVKNGLLYKVEPRPFAEKDCMIFLSNHLMSFDVTNAESLGIRKKDTDHILPDGLSEGIAEHTIKLALDSKKYPWTRHVPKDIFYEYVLNFVNVNEPRTNWRPLFVEALGPVLASSMKESYTVEQLIVAVNAYIWTAFGGTTSGRNQRQIFFKSGQTPSIMDPMSVIAFGYASCTGVSIFLVNALRAAGIPARLAGTSAWYGKPENGNHSWIEFYGSDGKWHIMESLPAAGGAPHDLFDPCQWWFCRPEKIQGTTFFAAKLLWMNSTTNSMCYYPMAWDIDNHCVPGEDRTTFMQELCSNCK